MLKEKRNKGITLIALIITVIVLLILAGVTIAAISGNESILGKAQEAKINTQNADELDSLKLAATNAIAQGGYSLTTDLETLKDGIKNVIKEDVETTITGEGPWVVTGKASGTKYIIDNEGEVYVDGAPAGVTVPEGFVASQATGENTVEGGLVIYQGTEPVTNANVEEARKTRNQFVWVPVDGTNLEYKKDLTYVNANLYQYEYKNYVDWTDSAAESNEASVKKYKGFYIGRYEAGWEDINQQTVANSATNVAYEGKNNENKTPVMKKGYAAWDLVSQETALSVSEKLYKNNTETTGVSGVKSQLVDSWAWDTTVNWLKDTGAITVNANKTMTSVGYGNYFDSTFGVSNVLYVPQRYYKDKKSTSSAAASKWNWATGYKVGSFSTVKGDDAKNKLTAVDSGGSADYDSEYIKPSLSLGATDETKTNNIYDLAGNLWEWTTEVGNHKTSSTDTSKGNFAVLRGGSFGNYGGSYPVVYRYGPYSTSHSGDIGVGFRVVLYLDV